MMPQNIPYQILFLTQQLLQRRDQWPPRLMTPSFLQERRPRQLLQITRRQLYGFCPLGLLSSHTPMTRPLNLQQSVVLQLSLICFQILPLHMRLLGLLNCGPPCSIDDQRFLHIFLTIVNFYSGESKAVTTLLVWCCACSLFSALGPFKSVVFCR